jgi:hypothetical protein
MTMPNDTINTAVTTRQTLTIMLLLGNEARRRAGRATAWEGSLSLRRSNSNDGRCRQAINVRQAFAKTSSTQSSHRYSHFIYKHDVIRPYSAALKTQLSSISSGCNSGIRLAIMLHNRAVSSAVSVAMTSHSRRRSRIEMRGALRRPRLPGAIGVSVAHTSPLLFLSSSSSSSSSSSFS